MAGGRVDEVPDNVFRVPSRINSTWGGNLTDMVRSRRQLEVIAEDGLVDRAAVLGKRLLDDLRAVPGIDNVRGRGLFVAFDLPDARGPRGGAATPARGARAGARRRRALDPAASGVDHRGGRPGLAVATRRIRERRVRLSGDICGLSFIGGTWRDDAPGGRLTSVDPASGDAGRRGPAGRRGGLRRGVPHRPRRPARLGRHPRARARDAWSSASAGIVEANKEALAALVTREIGKPLAESRGEVQEVIDTCSFFAGEGRRLYGQTVPSEMLDKQLFTFRVPVGVAAIVTAGNFPVAVPSWYLVPALLCGNAVVWKPAEYTPAIARAFTELFVAGGLPAGVLNTVLADGPATYDGLSTALDDGLVQKIGFTGSSAVGVRIGELAGRHLQTPCLELGGKNPLVVMPDADLDLAVEGALFSGFGTAGQRCTSLGTVIVHESVHDAFLARFDEAVRTARIGDPTDDVLYGPMISARFLRELREAPGPRRAAPHAARLDRHRPDHGRQPARRLRRRPRGPLRPPDRRRRGAPRGRPLPHGDVRADGRRGHVLDVRRGRRAGQRARLRAVGGDLHHRPGARVPVPRAGERGDGEREQLDVRRRGAPPVRRQRPLRQRVAAVRGVGARPVHALAEPQLGLRGPAAEGADGHPRPPGRPGLPAGLTGPGATARVPPAGGGLARVSRRAPATTSRRARWGAR